MAALFDNLTAAQNDDRICILHGRQSVGDHQHGFVSDQYFKGFLNLMFVFRVGKSGGLIQHHNGSVFQDGPRQSDPLLLTAGEIDTFRSNYSVQTLGQFFQNVIAPGRMGGGQDLISGSFRSGGTDIFQETFLKQPGILKDKSHLLHQIFCVDLPDIDSSNRNRTAVRIPEAGDQAGGCRLASAGRTYQRRHLTGAN